MSWWYTFRGQSPTLTGRCHGGIQPLWDRSAWLKVLFGLSKAKVWKLSFAKQRMQRFGSLGSRSSTWTIWIHLGEVYSNWKQCSAALIFFGSDFCCYGRWKRQERVPGKYTDHISMLQPTAAELRPYGLHSVSHRLQINIQRAKLAEWERERERATSW